MIPCSTDNFIFLYPFFSWLSSGNWPGILQLCLSDIYILELSSNNFVNLDLRNYLPFALNILYPFRGVKSKFPAAQTSVTPLYYFSSFLFYDSALYKQLHLSSLPIGHISQSYPQRTPSTLVYEIICHLL